MSILGRVGDALQRLRCNAWRWNAKTKAYDRVDEDVKIVEDQLELCTEALHEAPCTCRPHAVLGPDGKRTNYACLRCRALEEAK